MFPCDFTNIDSRGFWLFVEGREFYLDYSTFPWFLDAPVKHIINVKKETGDSLYWPDLDVDLTLEMIELPDRFPLKAKCIDLVAESSDEYVV